MCILLKLRYAKFGISYLYFSKVIQEKPWGGGGGRSPLTLVKEGLKLCTIFRFLLKLADRLSF